MKKLMNADAVPSGRLRRSGTVTAVLRAYTARPLGLVHLQTMNIDLRLVDSDQRSRISGRPTLHVATDAYSGLIAGIAVSLDDRKVGGMFAALLNVTADKCRYCETHGISIDADAWPVAHLPEAITVDGSRIALAGASILTDQLGVQVITLVSTNSLYRKVAVERHFTLHTNKLPDAVLSLRDFERLVIHFVLHYNHEHRIPEKAMPEAAREDGIASIPVALWRWGCANLTYALRTVNTEVVNRALLPRGKATLTAKGLLFRGLYYNSAHCIREGWFTRAAEVGRSSVAIRYDPNLVDTVLLALGDRLERCELLWRSEEYLGRSWQELPSRGLSAKRASSPSSSSPTSPRRA